MTQAAPRIVAELGRPETPDETAVRKAESSRVYRSSQTVRNLVAALLVTLGLVAVMIAMVPRGSFPQSARIDVAAVAKQVSSGYDEVAIVPHVPDSWTVNSAAVGGDVVDTWTVVYVPNGPGYLDVAQGFDADPAWATRLLHGAASDGTVAIDGITWTRYAIDDAAEAGNVTYALGTDAGKDGVLIYGTASAEAAEVAARGVADQIRALRAASE